MFPWVTSFRVRRRVEDLRGAPVPPQLAFHVKSKERAQHRRTARAGLFTEISERPPELLSAPLEIFGKPRAFDPARSATAQALSESLGLTTRRLLRTQEEKGRAWLQGSYLEVRVANPAAAHDSVIPHDMCRFKPHTASSACMGSENIA